MKTSISFLGVDYDFYKFIDRINASDADYIHIDVADGLFVNNRTAFNKEMLDYLKKSKKPKDVHLMTLHLKDFIDVFSYIQPKYITYPFEATTKHNQLIKYIKEKNCKVGIAISPLTDLKEIIPFLKKVDLIIVMSIIPGYGGQKFLPSTPKRIEELKELRKQKNATFKISVDGGINKESIETLKDTKPDIIIAGSYVYKSGNFNERINKLKNN